MPAKQIIEKRIFSNVGGNSTSEWESPIIPVGKKAIITSFGGCAPSQNGDDSLIALQIKSSGGTYQYYKVMCGAFDLKIGKEIIGDGQVQVRVRRQNRSSQPLPMFVELHAIVSDV